MEEAYPTTNSMEIKLNLSTPTPKDINACNKSYKQLMGCIMYANIGTRPMLSFQLLQSFPFSSY